MDERLDELYTKLGLHWCQEDDPYKPYDLAPIPKCSITKDVPITVSNTTVLQLNMQEV